MSENLDRLQLAQWTLERNLHWIAAAEVKTGVIITIDMAMLGALATAFGTLTPSTRALSANIFTFLSAGCLGWSIFCAGMSVMPRVTGPESSFIFFGKIVNQSSSDYLESFRNATDTELLEDCLAQVHRNAEIACAKFKWVRASMGWSFAAVVPWVFALCQLIRA